MFTILRVCACLCVYACVYVFVSSCLSLDEREFGGVCWYVYGVFICMSMDLCVCMSKWVSTCVCVCGWMCVGMCVSVCVHVYVCIYCMTLATACL